MSRTVWLKLTFPGTTASPLKTERRCGMNYRVKVDNGHDPILVRLDNPTGHMPIMKTLKDQTNFQ